jgi:hypothetical protein
MAARSVLNNFSGPARNANKSLPRLYATAVPDNPAGRGSGPPVVFRSRGTDTTTTGNPPTTTVTPPEQPPPDGNPIGRNGPPPAPPGREGEVPVGTDTTTGGMSALGVNGETEPKRGRKRPWWIDDARSMIGSLFGTEGGDKPTTRNSGGMGSLS